MKTFCIQTFDGEIQHDFSFALINACKYQNWLNREDIFKWFLVDGINQIDNHIDLIPVGSVEFVSDFLNEFYNKKPTPINIPTKLMKDKFLNRNVVHLNTIGLEPIIFDDHKFIKSMDIIKGDVEITNKIPEGRYLVSDVVNFISEWRGFVFKNELVGLQNYLGRFDLFPNVDVIREMIHEYTDAPIAYTIDVGILDSNKTAIIEVHDFFSCGLYGFSNYNILPFMFTRWFYEFINK